jgi:hypothetical protein
VPVIFRAVCPEWRDVAAASVGAPLVDQPAASMSNGSVIWF